MDVPIININTGESNGEMVKLKKIGIFKRVLYVGAVRDANHSVMGRRLELHDTSKLLSPDRNVEVLCYDKKMFDYATHLDYNGTDVRVILYFDPELSSIIPYNGIGITCHHKGSLPDFLELLYGMNSIEQMGKAILANNIILACKFSVAGGEVYDSIYHEYMDYYLDMNSYAVRFMPRDVPREIIGGDEEYCWAPKRSQ